MPRGLLSHHTAGTREILVGISRPYLAGLTEPDGLSGVPVDRRQLMPQDEVVIGKFTIRLHSPTATPTPQQTMMMQASTGQSELFLVGDETSLPLRDELSLGKVAGVDLRLPGLFTKPIHARLKNNGDGTARLTCIGKARVQINGHKTGQAVLEPNDVFRVGRTELRLVQIPRHRPATS